jgi:hypothetical protein
MLGSSHSSPLAVGGSEAEYSKRMSFSDLGPSFKPAVATAGSWATVCNKLGLRPFKTDLARDCFVGSIKRTQAAVSPITFV